MEVWEGCGSKVIEGEKSLMPNLVFLWSRGEAGDAGPPRTLLHASLGGMKNSVLTAQLCVCYTLLFSTLPETRELKLTL